MADINNPQAIRFVNDRVRKLADLFLEVHYAAKQTKDFFALLTGPSAIPNDASLILDGADAAGRPNITGADVNGLISYLATIVADLEANGNTKLNVLLKVSNGNPPAGLR